MQHGSLTACSGNMHGSIAGMSMANYVEQQPVLDADFHLTTSRTPRTPRLLTDCPLHCSASHAMHRLCDWAHAPC